MDYDHESLVQEYAIMSRWKKINGFQGCVNKTQCGHYGFYLQEYSKEGLCEQCESQLFPDRYIACPFCRQAMKKHSADALSVCCGECCMKIADLIVKQFDMKCTHGSAINHVMRYLLSSEKDISREFIRYKAHDKVHGMIYRGAIRLGKNKKRHIWSNIINVEDSDKGFLVDDAFMSPIGYICKKYNIFGPETRRKFVGEISKGDVTYDETTLDNSHKN